MPTSAERCHAAHPGGRPAVCVGDETGQRCARLPHDEVEPICDHDARP